MFGKLSSWTQHDKKIEMLTQSNNRPEDRKKTPDGDRNYSFRQWPANRSGS
jgi:hypothetical protein